MDRELLSHSLSSGAGARMNALKHARYAKSILLPGEDANDYLRERRALFHTYLPQTKDEADLVDAMAEHLWVARRYGPAQARFDAQSLHPATDAAGTVAEPVAHQRLHSGMDVSVQRKRLEFMWHRARSRLLELQRLRRLGLVAGAVGLPAGCYVETDCRVYGPVLRPAVIPLPEPPLDAVETDSVTRQDHRASRFGAEQKENPAPALLKPHPASTPWSAYGAGHPSLHSGQTLLLQPHGKEQPRPLTPQQLQGEAARGTEGAPGGTGQRGFPERSDGTRLSTERPAPGFSAPVTPFPHRYAAAGHASHAPPGTRFTAVSSC